MTSSMGQKRWTDSWGEAGGRRHSLDRGGGVGGRTRAGSGVSSLTDYSLERPNTRDTTTSFLLREQSTVSSHVDSTSYQEKLQGWSAVFHDSAVLAPRPGTSINTVRSHPNLSGSTTNEVEREISFLHSNSSKAFPAKPRELYDPLDGMLPSQRLVAQRKYYVLPSIGHQSGLFMRRQHSSLETLNQLDYSRDQLEDDADFFAELIELKRETRQAVAPASQCTSANPLPPIAKLRDVVRPRTNIAELDEDYLDLSERVSPAGMSDISDVEEFRAKTPDPDYADTSPRKLTFSPTRNRQMDERRGSGCSSVDSLAPMGPAGGFAEDYD